MGLIGICLVAVPFVLLMRLIYEHQVGESEWVDASPAFRSLFRKSSREWKQFDSSFRRKSAATCWPPTVVQLAQAYLGGEECGFALHDALLEAGKAELADVFGTPDHPRRFRVAEEIAIGDSENSEPVTPLLRFEAKITCRYCSCEFRAYVRLPAPPSAKQTFAVRCPSNASVVTFPGAVLKQTVKCSEEAIEASIVPSA